MAWAAFSGCAVLGSPGEAVGPSLAGSANLRHRTDRKRGITSVLIVPMMVRRMHGTGMAQGARVAVGALFSTRAVRGDTLSATGLVIQAVGARSGPLLARPRRLLLEVDGTLVAGNVAAQGARVYEARPGSAGLVETVVIPVGPALLRRLARAKRIRALYGEDIAFELGKEHRSAFGMLLREIPPQVRFGTIKAAIAMTIAQ